jgi:predicted metal-dependent peptidase
MMPDRLAAARLRLLRGRDTQDPLARPYLAAALYAIQPVERPGLGTLAVDRWWRLYFDPAVCAAWSVEELAAALYHEISHLLRDHAARMEGLGVDASVANLATDAEINDGILDEGFRLPGHPVTPGSLGQPNGLLAEEYAVALRDQAQRSRPHSRSAKTTASGAGNAGEDTEAGRPSAQGTAPSSAPGSDEGHGPAPSPPVDGGHAEQETPESSGGASASQPGDAGDSHAGDGPGSMPGPSSGKSPAAPANAGAPSEPPIGPVPTGRTAGSKGTGSGDGAETPAPDPSCGSGAHGHAEPWEEPAPSEGGAPGLGRAEAEILRRQVAEAIRSAAASSSPGTVPEAWRRWAEAKLSPRVDWRRELASLIRRAVAEVSGAADYSFRRPSRRQSVSQAILPSLRQPVPEVAVVVDTSASVSDAQLSRALAEVAGILRAVGTREGVRVLAVDAAVQACRRVWRPEQIALAGGGGTDMGEGIAAAVRLRPRPQVVVVLTDGYTPWPDLPPRGVRVIVALVGDGNAPAPAWAKTVKTEV